jgi:Ca2+-binding RTX toxin-like protein
MVTQFGTNNNDTIEGGRKNDLIYGQGGNDSLKGSAGKDVLKGGAGKDILEGDAGKDTLTGGAGADKFVFSSSSEGIDTISNFSDGDKIVIRQESFDATSKSQFSYNNDTGALLFDVSSTDDIAPVQFASLPRNLGSTFNSEQDITFSAGNSDIDTSGNIIDSNNNNISNVDTNGNDFRADPGTIDIQ